MSSLAPLDLKKLKELIEEDKIDEVLKILRPHKYYDDGENALHLAVALGLTELIPMLIKKKPSLLNSKDDYENTPLHTAAGNGNLECAKILLDAGADFTLKNVRGWTPLNKASSENSLALLKMLIAKGSDIESTDNDGDTPLLRAVGSGKLELALFLIKQGAKLNAVNKKGNTILHKAGYGYGIIPLLLSLGVNIETRNKEGQNALDYTSGQSRTVLEISKMINPLLSPEHMQVIANLIAAEYADRKDGKDTIIPGQRYFRDSDLLGKLNDIYIPLAIEEFFSYHPKILEEAIRREVQRRNPDKKDAAEDKTLLEEARKQIINAAHRVISWQLDICYLPDTKESREFIAPFIEGASQDAELRKPSLGKSTEMSPKTMLDVLDIPLLDRPVKGFSLLSESQFSQKMADATKEKLKNHYKALAQQFLEESKKKKEMKDTKDVKEVKDTKERKESSDIANIRNEVKMLVEASKKNNETLKQDTLRKIIPTLEKLNAEQGAHFFISLPEEERSVLSTMILLQNPIGEKLIQLIQVAIKEGGSEEGSNNLHHLSETIKYNFPKESELSQLWWTALYANISSGTSVLLERRSFANRLFKTTKKAHAVAYLTKVLPKNRTEELMLFPMPFKGSPSFLSVCLQWSIEHSGTVDALFKYLFPRAYNSLSAEAVKKLATDLIGYHLDFNIKEVYEDFDYGLLRIPASEISLLLQELFFAKLRSYQKNWEEGETIKFLTSGGNEILFDNFYIIVQTLRCHNADRYERLKEDFYSQDPDEQQRRRAKLLQLDAKLLQEGNVIFNNLIKGLSENLTNPTIRALFLHSALEFAREDKGRKYSGVESYTLNTPQMLTNLSSPLLIAMNDHFKAASEIKNVADQNAAILNPQILNTLSNFKIFKDKITAQMPALDEKASQEERQSREAKITAAATNEMLGLIRKITQQYIPKGLQEKFVLTVANLAGNHQDPMPQSLKEEMAIFLSDAIYGGKSLTKKEDIQIIRKMYDVLSRIPLDGKQSVSVNEYINKFFVPKIIGMYETLELTLDPIEKNRLNSSLFSETQDRLSPKLLKDLVSGLESGQGLEKFVEEETEEQKLEKENKVRNDQKDRKVAQSQIPAQGTSVTPGLDAEVAASSNTSESKERKGQPETKTEPSYSDKEAKRREKFLSGFYNRQPGKPAATPGNAPEPKKDETNKTKKPPVKKPKRDH